MSRGARASTLRGPRRPPAAELVECCLRARATDSRGYSKNFTHLQIAACHSSNAFIGFVPISCNADIMAKRAASTHSPDDASSLALNDHLSDAAQQQLAPLRRALESRLAVVGRHRT